jgi:uncharacterized protein
MLFIEDLPIKILADKLLLYVKVTPRASSNKLGKVLNKTLKIYVTEVAEAGQANKAVINLLSEKLRIKKSDIVIIHGLTDSKKVLSINSEVELLTQQLKNLLQ